MAKTKNIFTYAVDHGIESPRVYAGLDVNGGKVIAVSFTDMFEYAESVEMFLTSLRCETSCNQTKYAIDDFLAP